MKHIIFFGSLAQSVGIALDSDLNGVVLAIMCCLICFGFFYSYNLIFTVFALLTSLSYRLCDLNSEVFFYSTLLPWVFGISFVCMTLGVIIKYRMYRYMDCIFGGADIIDL